MEQIDVQRQQRQFQPAPAAAAEAARHPVRQAQQAEVCLLHCSRSKAQSSTWVPQAQPNTQQPCFVYQHFYRKGFAPALCFTRRNLLVPPTMA